MHSVEEIEPILQKTTVIESYTVHDEETGKPKVIQKETKVWFWTSDSFVWSLATLVLLFMTFTALEYILIRLNLPSINPEDRDDIKFPRNLQDLRRLNDILSVYMDQHFANVYITFFITYVYLQSFSIPGSMWLSILSGALFNFWIALITVSLCSAIGASIAYIISGSLGSVAIMKLVGHRLDQWNRQLVQHKQHMFNYMIVLRISPLPPNWTVNLGSPHFGVPLTSFFWGTFVGVAPPSFIHVQAGAALDRLSSSDKLELLTPTNVACLMAVALVALLPVFIRRRLAVA
ncbi:Transmembrane protein 41 [Choanephora cucurbitarum]|uniref:Transmembrane protein 41 n=1 Tax=Choanephora cucurbitarum TaxID=101091 RepID=A0A1C7N6C5_9FUNG|nr:Transmembrane protein 41 [Choanephora cucurbitarum]